MTPATATNIFKGMQLRHLIALSRIAKAKNKGMRPFTADVKIMIALRKEIERRT